MKTPDIPRGLHAKHYHDEFGGTCVVLLDKSNKVVAAGIARYNPKDASDPLHPFDPEFGRKIALGRAVKQYEKKFYPSYSCSPTASIGKYATLPEAA